VQTNAPSANGSYTTNYGDIGLFILGPGTGESTTNILRIGGATNVPALDYRVRLVP